MVSGTTKRCSKCKGFYRLSTYAPAPMGTTWTCDQCVQNLEFMESILATYRRKAAESMEPTTVVCGGGCGTEIIIDPPPPRGEAFTVMCTGCYEGKTQDPVYLAEQAIKTVREMYKIDEMKMIGGDGIGVLVGAITKYTKQFQDRIDKAFEIIDQSGGVDGAHHKMWVIDQVLRALCRTHDDYLQFIADRKQDGYTWDCGIAPCVPDDTTSSM